MRNHILFGFVTFIFSFCVSAQEQSDRTLQVGSKKFTEAVTLGEISKYLLIENGIKASHRQELGGTRILWNAILSGDIDLYIDYTGTVSEEILKQKFESFSDFKNALRTFKLGALEPLGFNNTYALGVKRQLAEKLSLKKISDLADHPELAFGFSAEFSKRQDGWLGLKSKYRLPQKNVRALDHDIAYRALQNNDVQVTDLYSTDAEIGYYDLIILKDDLNFFPSYQAFILYRLDLEQTHPAAIQQLRKLSGQISESEMSSMNREAKIKKETSSKVATDFLNQNFGSSLVEEKSDLLQRLTLRTQEHLSLVIISLLFSILVGLPLGIVAFEKRFLGGLIFGTVEIIQTIPALALLVILIKPLSFLGLQGIGNTPAFVALFLYSLLPIVRGTFSGLNQIPNQLQEVSSVLNLSPQMKLLKINLPLALPSILNGVKTSAVLNIGFATLGALVGAGGFGQPILTGIRLDDYSLILEGALPAAALAIASRFIFDWLERRLVSKGLR